MAKQTIENLESAAAVRGKINGNFTDLYDNKAPNSHSSSNTTYGIASTTLYGHIKVTAGNGLDIANGVISMAAASTSAVGAVQLNNTLTSTSTAQALTAAQGKALKDSLDTLSSGKAPSSHASSETTYGVATTSLYGHIKVATGNGLNLSSGVLSMSAASTNAVGAVQLNNTLTSTSTTQALTAAQGKALYDAKAQAYYGSSAPSSSTGKNGDIYFLTS